MTKASGELGFAPRSIWGIAWPYVALLGCFLVLSIGSIEVLSGVRAYVGGEGLYSKAQKEAVAALTRYRWTHSENDFRVFQRAIAIPLGDRTARLELLKDDPNLQVASEGFLAAQNSAADLGRIIFLFRWGRWFGPMKHAVDLWAVGDAYVSEINDLGRQLHEDASDQNKSAEDKRAIAARLREIDDTLTPMEDEFSATLGEGARELQGILVLVLIGTAGTLAALAVAIFQRHHAERARYESTLRNSEARYRSVFESSIDCIVICSPVGLILEANPAAARLFGYSSAELVSLGIGELIDENSQNASTAFFGGLQSSHFQGTLEFRKKDATRFLGEVSLAMFTDLHGEHRSSVVVRDVTEKTRLVQSIIRSEERMELALEGADLGMWDFDIPSGKFAGNQRLIAMIGYAPGEIEVDTSTFDLLLHPDDAGKMTSAFYGHLKGQIATYEAEYRLRHKDGHWVWIVSRGKVVQRDENGRALRIVGTNKDITTRKMAEENEQRLSRAFRLLSKCDSVLVHADDQAELLAKICTLTVEIGGYVMAWVGFAQNDPREPVLALAHAGVEDGYLSLAGVVDHCADDCQEPVVAAIRTGATVVVQDVSAKAQTASWRDAARARGYRSCVALPLVANGDVLGAFAIYSCELEAFHQHEVELLEQLAADLAYGIQTLRSRREHREAQIVLKRESEKNQALLRNASDGIHIMDADGFLLEASDSFCSMLGYTREAVIGKHVSEWDASLSRQQIAEILGRQFLARTRYQFETRHRRGDGTTFDVEVSSISINLDGGAVLFNSSRDITERKRAEESLRESEQRFRAVIEQSPIGVAFARDGIIVDANAVYLRMFGYDNVAEVRGRKLLEQIVYRRPSDLDDRTAPATVADQVEGAYETVALRKDGSEFPVYVSAKRLEFKDGPSTIAFLIDITRQKMSEEEIRRLAFFDHLTELPNRRLLKDRLQQALLSSERTGRRGALLFIDLDDFKSLNDTLGHAAGDALLQEVARRLKSCLRETDSIARMGGDEFVVVLEDLSDQIAAAARQTEAICEKLLAVLDRRYELFSDEYQCTASIGATLFCGREGPGVDLVKQADIAMYEAKKAGRKNLRFFDPKMQDAVNAQAALAAELRRAVEKREFALHFQVQVDSSNRVFGAEALLRWNHPVRGLVLPGQFIEVAESTDLIIPMGQLVLETACAQLQSWATSAETRDLTLCVNVSAKQFHKAEFVGTVRALVRRYAVNPKRLVLELTESSLLSDTEETIATMNALRDIGVQFSLDDFGTGYSSLQYLKRLPLRQLKIDRSFVRDIAVDSSDLSIVQTIIAMARSLNLRVIAEGVETQEQRRLLLNMGCVEFQGFLFGKPVSIDQFNLALKLPAVAN